MRTRIKVTDLTLRQWDHLQDNLQASYDIPENGVRVCVEFELHCEMDPRHVEMPVRAFMALMTRLQRIEVHGQTEEGVAELPPLPPKWSAPLTPVEAGAILTGENLATGPTCDHGAAVVNERPSAFEGAEPVRDYADGCQSYGPYQSLDT
jgi:hypothetical protein